LLERAWKNRDYSWSHLARHGIAASYGTKAKVIEQRREKIMLTNFAESKQTESDGSNPGMEASIDLSCIAIFYAVPHLSSAPSRTKKVSHPLIPAHGNHSAGDIGPAIIDKYAPHTASRLF